MTHACLSWKFAADIHILKLVRSQNSVFFTTGKFPWSTQVRELHMAFQMPYICKYVTKFCR
jgi:hypothetical protein